MGVAQISNVTLLGTIILFPFLLGVLKYWMFSSERLKQR
jgi:hypothetical protein